MTSMHASDTDAGGSLRRTVGLTRWNAVLLARNRLALFYAAGLPLLPVLLLLASPRGDAGAGASAAGLVWIVAGAFPVFYNVLSQFVSRREELVLKRLRSGETRDAELLASIALPGVATALLILTAVVPVAAVLGQPMPLNPVLLALGALATVMMFAAMAFWTASWTRSAESAQLTSMPVVFLVSIGPMGPALASAPAVVGELFALTPGAAIIDLVRAAWFGFESAGAAAPTLSAAGSWSAAAQPLLVIAAWAALALWVARRQMRWEPRG